MNDFNEDLEFSHSQEMASWWLECYQKAFPTMSACVNVRNDGWAQRGGIDRQIVLNCGRVVSVDEKVRRKDYGDILLEIFSDKDRKAQGWAIKPLACDFIAYAIAPTNKCFLFPTLNLQWALQKNKKEWNEKAVNKIDGFGYREAINRSWITQNMQVPADILLNAVKETLVITL